MKRPMRAMIRVSGAAVILVALTAAIRPSVFTQTSGGLWEVSRSNGVRRSLCVADPALLAQYEHIGGRCSREIIRNQQRSAEISYSCAGGGFGQTRVEQITPRSLRIETQGISDNAPFHYVLQARRVGDC